MEKRDHRITWMQYVCSLLVVLLHTRNIDHLPAQVVAGYPRWLTWLVDALSTLGCMAVPVFFALSGYLLFRSYRPEQYLAKLRSRVRTLLVPYLLWNLIGFLYAFVTSNLPGVAGMTAVAPVQLSWQVIPDILLSRYTTLWYVLYLMLYVLLTPLIHLLVQRKPLALCVLAGLSAYLIIAGYPYYSPVTWLPLYLMGACLGAWCPDWHLRTQRTAPAVRWAVWIAGAGAFLWATLRYSDVSRAMYVLRLLSPAVIWLAFEGLTLPRPPAWATLSFFLYCSHLYLLPVVQKGLLLVLGNAWLPELIVYLVTPVITVLLVTLAARLMRRYLPPVWSLLSGGR